MLCLLSDRSRETPNRKAKFMAYSSDDDDDRGGSSPDRSPNDDRSDVMNPNNPDYEADQANQASQSDD
jgi:hypothetical protein